LSHRDPPAAATASPLTLSIQYESPGKEKESNWLPALEPFKADYRSLQEVT